MTYPQLRDDRQWKVHEWCERAFGADHASSIKQRALRLIEEAVEAGQACDVDPAMLHKMIDYIYARPVGTLRQELGGVGVTLLALAAAGDFSADECEAHEFARVLAKPLEHFAARNKVKNDAGFNVVPPR